MSETYEFEAAKPVKRPGRQGAGRKPEENPFEAAVAAIVNTDEARATTFTLDAENGETLKQRLARVRRLLTRAGKELAEKHGHGDAYRIERSVEPVEGQADTWRVTFWHKRQD